jgi:hypothetical protein
MVKNVWQNECREWSEYLHEDDSEGIETCWSLMLCLQHDTPQYCAYQQPEDDQGRYFWAEEG